MVFNLDIDLYFWHVDRGDIVDDQRNNVSIDDAIVQLHKEHSDRIENGVYIGKVMYGIRREILKQNKTFSMDPQLNNLKDLATPADKEYNWDLICKEIKHLKVNNLSIKISTLEKDKIVKQKDHQVINDILNQLRTCDDQVKMNNEASRQMENKSELNYEKGSPLEKQNVPFELASNQYERRGNSQLKNKNAKNKRFYRDASHNVLNSQMKKKQLVPFESNARNKNQGRLPYINNSQQKDRSNLVLHNISRINEYNNQLDEETLLEQIGGDSLEPNEFYGDFSELQEAETTVMFIFSSLKISLGMRHNQIGGLLANSHKYLIHMCIKGLKGKDFTKIVNWYKLVNDNIFQLVQLLVNEQDQVKHTLDVLKCGFFSKSAKVSNMCCKVFTKITQQYNENNLNDLKFQFLNWLVNQKQQVISSPPKASQKKETKQNLELEEFLNEAGLKSFIRAYTKHQTDFTEQFVIFLIQAGKDNYIDLLTNQLNVNSANTNEYLGLIQDIYEIMFATTSGRNALIDSGAFHVLIDLCHSVADNPQVYQQQSKDQYDSIATQNHFNNINERQRALVILVDFWQTKPEIIQSKENDGRITEAILSVLKKGTRDRSKAVSILSMNLMSSLLDSFSKDKNKYAPMIYKGMTFILIECYVNLELREELLNIFINLFKTNSTIPIQILCDPLLKQIWIHLEKSKEIYISSENNILQPQSEYFTINTTDFEFFMNIAIHPKLTSNVAIQLLQIVLEISRRNVIFTRISLKLLLTILNRFENNTQIHEFLQNQVREIMKIMISQDQSKLEIYYILIKDPKNFAMIRKKSFQNIGVNLSQDTNDFNTLLNVKTSHNVRLKQQTNDATMRLDKTKGIVTSSSLLNGEKFLDDSDLQAVMNPSVFQEESSKYMSIRTHEKMIINQLQCLFNTGIKVLVDYIRGQILDTYIKIERRFKFKNKGLLYLLNLYEKDVTKMLQYYNNEQIKIKSEKQKQRQTEQSDTNQQNYGISDQSINQLKTPYRYDKKIVPETVKALKTSDKKKHALSQVSLSKEYVNKSKLKQDKVLNQLKSRPNSISVGSKLELYNPKRNFGEPVPVKALEIGKSLDNSKIKLFDIFSCPVNEIEKYQVWINQYMKLYKAMFHKYATVSQNKASLKQLTFDDMKDQQQSMSISEIFAFLNDFQITVNYKFTREQIKKIINLINLKSETQQKNSLDLDKFGFIEFVLQIAHMINQSQVPSVFLPLFFRYLKNVSFASNKPLFQRLFEDPTATSLGDPKLIQQLNDYVNQNPEYILPPGFVKFKTKQLVDKYNSHEQNESVQLVQEVFDEIFVDIFGIHSLNPQSTMIEKWVVKPDIFQQKMVRNLKPKFDVIPKKHQFDPGIENMSNFEFEQHQMKYGHIPRKQKTKLPVINSESIGAELKKKRTIEKNPQLREALPSQQKESELDMTLKIKIAQNVRHPLRTEMKESALLLEDMLRAIEKGHRELTPRTKHRIYLAKPLKKEGMPVNKAVASKLESKQLQQEQEKQSRQALQQRQFTLKNKLKVYSNQKEQQKKIDMDKKEREQELQKLRDEDKQRQRKEFYEGIKQEYNEKRLPALMIKEQQEKQNRRDQREQKKNNQNLAEQKVQLTISLLQKSFEEKIRQKKHDIEKQELEERKMKNIIKKNNDKYLQNQREKEYENQDEPIPQAQNIPYQQAQNVQSIQAPPTKQKQKKYGVF